MGADEQASPCQACGACCATFRVSFYWAEADDGHGEVPAGLTVQISPQLRAMAGTQARPPRCVALLGRVGDRVACSIYARRSSTCRDFEPSWAFGRPNPDCDRARAAHGLAPLGPESWPQAPRPGTRAA